MPSSCRAAHLVHPDDRAAVCEEEQLPRAGVRRAARAAQRALDALAAEDLDAAVGGAHLRGGAAARPSACARMRLRVRCMARRALALTRSPAHAAAAAALCAGAARVCQQSNQPARSGYTGASGRLCAAHADTHREEPLGGLIRAAVGRERDARRCLKALGAVRKLRAVEPVRRQVRAVPAPSKELHGVLTPCSRGSTALGERSLPNLLQRRPRRPGSRPPLVGSTRSLCVGPLCSSRRPSCRGEIEFHLVALPLRII